MNISLPEAMKDFIDLQVKANCYNTRSEYLRDLVRREWDRERMRNLITEGGASSSRRNASMLMARHKQTLNKRQRKMKR